MQMLTSALMNHPSVQPSACAVTTIAVLPCQSLHICTVALLANYAPITNACSHHSCSSDELATSVIPAVGPLRPLRHEPLDKRLHLTHTGSSQGQHVVDGQHILHRAQCTARSA